MPLANQVAQIPPIPQVEYACHSAVWYWAAQEAQALQYTTVKTQETTLGNIVAIPNGPMAAMNGLPRGAALNLADPNLVLPPAGTVLLWTDGAGHAAVVTGPNQISGYNQIAQFVVPGNDRGFTQMAPAAVKPATAVCYPITEDNIVKTAGEVFRL